LHELLGCPEVCADASALPPDEILRRFTLARRDETARAGRVAKKLETLREEAVSWLRTCLDAGTEASASPGGPRPATSALATMRARMLDQQFTPEGVHREHSPDYHRMVLDTLNGLIAVGPAEGAEARAEAREAALAWFVYPSGKIVNFGETDSRDMTL